MAEVRSPRFSRPVAPRRTAHDSVHFEAGIALCEAAGCTVTDLFGEPLTDRTTGLLAAADAETHAALLEMIRSA
ncbi:inositol monophosphatase family protein [Glycomyces paridis]|uniref:inositol monophosphatase family protein n=1 Tax=Glycomyces paridis TaxID=2126555 RepID=UPI001F00F107|nr:inositol monophosphatase family protein [Glycomyces paridis]